MGNGKHLLFGLSVHFLGVTLPLVGWGYVGIIEKSTFLKQAVYTWVPSPYVPQRLRRTRMSLAFSPRRWFRTTALPGRLCPSHPTWAAFWALGHALHFYDAWLLHAFFFCWCFSSFYHGDSGFTTFNRQSECFRNFFPTGQKLPGISRWLSRKKIWTFKGTPQMPPPKAIRPY